jgi:hypothetical protein
MDSRIDAADGVGRCEAQSSGAATRRHLPERVRRDGDCVVLNIPMRFRRRKGRRQIVLPTDSGASGSMPELNRPLVLALARAWRWQEMLDSGKVGSVDELAKRLHMDSTYVARILRLTALSPALIEAVLAGEEPEGMTLRALMCDIRPDWSRQ